MRYAKRTALAGLMLVGFTACGGGGGDDGAQNGRLSLSITDAPVDDATGVVVDATTDDALTFLPPQNATVQANLLSTVNFAPPAAP